MVITGKKNKELKEARAQKIRDDWIRVMQMKMTQEKLAECYRTEGVNSYEQCAHLAQTVISQIPEGRVRLAGPSHPLCQRLAWVSNVRPGTDLASSLTHSLLGSFTSISVSPVLIRNLSENPHPSRSMSIVGVFHRWLACLPVSVDFSSCILMAFFPLKIRGFRLLEQRRNNAKMQ